MIRNRFNQRVVLNKGYNHLRRKVVKIFGQLYWGRPINLDIKEHMLVVRDYFPDQNAVLKFIEKKGQEGFDPTKPLWSFYILMNVGEDSSVVISKMHHALG